MPRLLSLPLAALFLVGCVPATGELVEVRGPAATTSVAAGITTLELVVAHPSWCDRWVSDPSASHTRVNVEGRDLSKKPYDFLIEASHQTNLADPVYVTALAFGADGRLRGQAVFGAHPFAKDKVLERSQRIGLLTEAAQAGGPQYLTSDGCVCAPGQPWIGTGTGSGCDADVITSFARLADTAGCALPAGAPLPVACDGQQYPNESPNRDLPCWAADSSGACRVGARTCADHDGYAYNAECVTTGNDPMAPSDALCAQYLACEQTACGDVAGCFRAAFAQSANIRCTLRVDPLTLQNAPIQSCDGGTSWSAELPGAPPTAGGDCLAAVVDSVAQPPFTIGLSQSMVMGAQVIATSCPATLQIDHIDAPYPMALPATKTLDLVLGDTLTHVTLDIVQECGGGDPPLVCSAQ